MGTTNIHINFAQFDSLIQIADYFHSEEVCKKAIAQERWGDTVVCPYCGGTHCHLCKDGRYICKDCQNKFSVLVGTIFENTKISLRKWFMAMYLISTISNQNESAHIDAIFIREELKELLLTLPQKTNTNSFPCIGKVENNVLWHKVKYFMEMLDYFLDTFTPAYKDKTSDLKMVHLHLGAPFC